MSAAVNPYAPPRAHVDDVSAANSEAEEIRREHIKHETSVRSIGILYYLSGGLMFLASLAMLGTSFAGTDRGFSVGVGVVYLVLGTLMLFVARGVRQLKPWARTTTTALAALGLLGFPVGTLINAYILYLVLSKKGKRVFADDYKDIIAATPHIKYRTSIVTWIVLGILVLGFVGLVVIGVLATRISG